MHLNFQKVLDKFKHTDRYGKVCWDRKKIAKIVLALNALAVFLFLWIAINFTAALTLTGMCLFAISLMWALLNIL